MKTMNATFYLVRAMFEKGDMVYHPQYGTGFIRGIWNRQDGTVLYGGYYPTYRYCSYTQKKSNPLKWCEANWLTLVKRSVKKEKQITTDHERYFIRR